MKYSVTVLVTGPGKHGEDPTFFFDNQKEFIRFLETCFDNGFAVEAERFRETEK